MVNVPKSPNNEGDRLVPPLHPTDPKYSPEVIDKKMAEKREKMARIKERFSEMQSRRAKKEATRKKLEKGEPLGYTDNLDEIGYLVQGSGSPKEIKHTEANDIFFKYVAETKRFELIYQGSAIIAGALDMAMLSRKEGRPDHPLALFDKSGEFYDQLILIDLSSEERNGNHSHQKHTATFETQTNGDREVIDIPVDDIFCIARAIPLSPGNQTSQ